MTTATALRVQASTLRHDEMDIVDLKMWADTASKMMEIAASEIDRLLARDQAHVDTIKVLANTLTRPEASAPGPHIANVR